MGPEVIIISLIVIFVILALCILFSNLCVVPQGNTWVIERLGKYSATWEAGLHIKTPILEKVVRKISMKEQVADFEPQSVITKDNVTMNVDSVVYFQVIDPKALTYGVERPIAAIENLCATTLRNIIGSMTLDETLVGRETINAETIKVLDEATNKGGIDITRVEVQNITPPLSIQEAMEKQMKAERDRRETLLEAEGHKQASITRAEGDKQALVLKAEAERDAAIARATGQAESIRLVYEAEARGIEMLKEANMDERVLLIKKLEALSKLGDGRATKIVVPTDLADAAADLTFKTEMLGFGNNTPVDGSATKKPAPKKEDPCCNDAEKSETTKHFANEHVDFDKI